MRASESAHKTHNRKARTSWHRRAAIIGLAMAAVVIAVSVLSLGADYQKDLGKQREYLVNMAQSHARTIGAEVRAGLRKSGDTGNHISFAAMNRIIAPLKYNYDAARTNDILLSRNEGGFASFILNRHHHQAVDHRYFDVRHSQPVRIDFQGRPGTAIGVDFRNIKVLAAYAPVKNTNLGIINKIDMAEIRAPFIENGIIISGIVLILVAIGTLCWIAEEPIIKDAEQARLQLIHTSKMATLGEMSSGIAHEMNQPLSIICMAADFALMSLQEGEFDKKIIEKKLITITSQGDRILDIISHMQAFSRKENSPRTPFIIHDAVSSAVEMIEPQLRADGIEIKITVGDARHCRIMGGPVQLEQVMLNILANARDTVRNRMSTTESEEIIFAPRIEIAMNRISAYGTVLISISNNGGNIPKWVMDNIFDPFFTTKKKGHGTGLGLSISDSIIVGMGGHIDVENIADGARFNITVPTI